MQQELFIPTFDAHCRAYAYLIHAYALQNLVKQCTALPDGAIAAERIAAAMLNNRMREIQGVTLDYFVVSHGKRKTETTLCTLVRARVSLVELKPSRMDMLLLRNDK